MNTFDSERLNYKLMSDRDADLMWELDQDPLVMKFISGGKPTSKTDIQNIMLPRLYSYRNVEKGWGLWRVNLKHQNTFIGWILVRPMDFFSSTPQENNLELGWRFKANSWGNGYATEAATRVRDYLLANYSGDLTFSALVKPKNTASIGVIKKLGMIYLKTAVHVDPLGDMLVDYYQTEGGSQSS
jgi:RimJ/RimL family protein N-acetyltransferase